MNKKIVLALSLFLVACASDPADDPESGGLANLPIDRPDIGSNDRPILEVDPIPDHVREALRDSIRDTGPGSDISALPDGVEVPQPPPLIDPDLISFPPFRVEVEAVTDGCNTFPATSSSLSYRLVAAGSDITLDSIRSDISITVIGVTLEEILDPDLEVPVLARSSEASATIDLAPRRSNTIRYGVIANRRSDGSRLGVGLVDIAPPPAIEFSAGFDDEEFMITERINGRFHWALPVRLKNVGFPSVDGFWRSTDPGQNGFRKFIDLDNPAATERFPSDNLNGVLETTIVFPANDEDLSQMGGEEFVLEFANLNRLSACLNMESSIRPLEAPPRLIVRLGTPAEEVGETGSCSAETVSSECSGPPPESVCFARGEEFSVSGETNCRRGRLTCDTRGSRDTEWCSGPQGTSGELTCGLGSGSGCSSTAECAPALFCRPDNSGRLACQPEEIPPAERDTREPCSLTPGTCWLPSELTSNDPALCRQSGEEPEIPEDFLACTPADEGTECTTESSRCSGVSIPGTLECFATEKFCRATPKGMAICREAARR